MEAVPELSEQPPPESPQPSVVERTEVEKLTEPDPLQIEVAS